MATMNISLPDELKAYVDAQVAEGAYGNNSELIRDLIRRDRARRELRNAIVDSLDSGAAREADADFFAAVRRDVLGDGGVGPSA